MFDLCSLSLWCIPGCRCSFPIGCLIHWVHSRSLLQTVWLWVFVGNVIPVTFKIHIGLSFLFPKLESSSTLPTSTYIIIHLAHLHIYHIHTNFWSIFMNYKLSTYPEFFHIFGPIVPFRRRPQEILKVLPGAPAPLLAWACSALTVLSCDGRHFAEMILQVGYGWIWRDGLVNYWNYGILGMIRHDITDITMVY